VSTSDPTASHAKGRFALPAVLLGSAALAFGPWLVRLAETPPVTSAFWRLALASLPLFVLARLSSGPVVITRASLALAALAAAFFAADLAAWHFGILGTTLGNATLLANGATFLLPLWGVIMLKQRLGGPGIAALALAAIGMALLLGQSAELSASHLQGDLLCLLAALFYTAYLITVDKLRSQLGALPILAIISLLAALMLLPAALTLGGGLSVGNWTPIIALALGSQVFGQGLIVYAISYLRPIVIGLALLIQPIISATLGLLRYNEMPGPLDLLGAALIAAALLLARLKPAPKIAPAVA
jgi:drug/metabolite transporter (DMT)-like permease